MESILRYSQFVTESKDNNTLVISEGMLQLENEYLRMISEGLTEEEINENIFSSILGSLGGGFTDIFKDYVIDWAAGKFGIKTMDDEGNPPFFYQVLRNVIEEIPFTELGNYFGKGSCKYWSIAVVKGLAETFEEKTVAYLLPKLGINMNINSGMSGTIAAGIREALTNSLNNIEFMQKVEHTISDKVCGFSLGDIISGKNTVDSSDKAQMKNQVKQAGEENPDIFSKLMKTGLSKLIPA
jgi:hypothetical protein